MVTVEEICKNLNVVALFQSNVLDVDVLVDESIKDGQIFSIHSEIFSERFLGFFFHNSD